MAEKIESYQDLKVWQRAMALAEACYHHTKIFPREEMFGLTSQIRRAAASIAANVAEGFGREQTRMFVQYLRMSQGSLKELETHLILARRVEIGSTDKCNQLLEQCQELGKMLRALIRRLQQKSA
ncbi:MAG: four helix bundle protein [Proteobacteria bacterium]|nr:four helix bundle protein [Pseudomonadota bacterium]